MLPIHVLHLGVLVAQIVDRLSVDTGMGFHEGRAVEAVRSVGGLVAMDQLWL